MLRKLQRSLHPAFVRGQTIDFLRHESLSSREDELR
jgi:hypothetical protein